MVPFSGLIQIYQLPSTPISHGILPGLLYDSVLNAVNDCQSLYQQMQQKRPVHRKYWQLQYKLFPVIFLATFFCS